MLFLSQNFLRFKCLNNFDFYLLNCCYLIAPYSPFVSRYSIVCTPINFEALRLRSRTSIPERDKSFSLLQNTYTDYAAHEASNSVGTWALFLEVKRPWGETAHKPASIVEDKNWCNYNSAPAYASKSCAGNKFAVPYFTDCILIWVKQYNRYAREYISA